MAVSSRTAQRVGHPDHPAFSPIQWGQRADAVLDFFFETIPRFLTRCLCRASRGYLCPPDMTQVMYPDEIEVAITGSVASEVDPAKERSEGDR